MSIHVSKDANNKILVQTNDDERIKLTLDEAYSEKRKLDSIFMPTGIERRRGEPVNTSSIIVKNIRFSLDEAKELHYELDKILKCMCDSCMESWEKEGF